jgi:hypothetical protein
MNMTCPPKTSPGNMLDLGLIRKGASEEAPLYTNEPENYVYFLNDVVIYGLNN